MNPISFAPGQNFTSGPGTASFVPSQFGKLSIVVEPLLLPETARKNIAAAVCPHFGWD
jgi:hypothetical protein